MLVADGVNVKALKTAKMFALLLYIVPGMLFNRAIHIIGFSDYSVSIGWFHACNDSRVKTAAAEGKCGGRHGLS